MQITVRKPTEAEKQFMQKQPTWSCGVSEFGWYYDSEENCLLIEGEVESYPPQRISDSPGTPGTTAAASALARGITSCSRRALIACGR